MVRHPTPVLLTVRELSSGGIERDVAKLALALDRERFTPYVGTYKPEGLRHDELKKAGVSILHLEINSFKSPRAVSSALQFKRFVAQHRIRVLHAFDTTAVFTVPLARLMRLPVILSSTLGDRRLLDCKSQKQMRFTDPLVDAHVVNCDAMRKHLVEDYGIARNRIELCYNGVDVREFYPADRPKLDALTNATMVIGTVCVLRPEKALDLLQRAFVVVKQRIPGAKLLIVGSGPELPKLQANAAHLRIGDASVFMPAVQQVAPIMRSIDIFVSSSHTEAFSNSILEAMGCGCAVVGSRVGGTPELIGDNERGLLFSPGNVDELSDRICELAKDPALRRRIGTKAAEFAATKLTMEANAARNAEIYETILQRKRKAA